ncbi:MAG: NAD-dependent deacylase [Bacillota bacterium]|nr:MAG: NAD-dependent deacylase [Bacillota bacterium]
MGSTSAVAGRLRELARDIVTANRRLAALTGAGISVSSGVPVFRGRDGLWSRYDPEEVAHIEAFRRDPERVWRMLAELYRVVGAAEPNAAHRALARLEELGYLEVVITQNVDGLHQKAGSREVVELHGSCREMVCLDCGARYGTEAIERVAAWPGRGAVRCWCGGVLKPGIVFFGEPLPEYAFLRAWAAVQSADVLLVVGTSAEVEPAASLPGIAMEAGTTVVEINPDPVLGAHVTIAARAEEVLPELVAAVEAERGA